MIKNALFENQLKQKQRNNESSPDATSNSSGSKEIGDEITVTKKEAFDECNTNHSAASNCPSLPHMTPKSQCNLSVDENILYEYVFSGLDKKKDTGKESDAPASPIPFSQARLHNEKLTDGDLQAYDGMANMFSDFTAEIIT